MSHGDSESPVIWKVGDSHGPAAGTWLAQFRPEWDVKNHTRSGSTSQHWVDGMLQDMINAEPVVADVVTVMLAGNDIAQGRTPADIAENLATIVARLHAIGVPQVLMGRQGFATDLDPNDLALDGEPWFDKLCRLTLGAYEVHEIQKTFDLPKPAYVDTWMKDSADYIWSDLTHEQRNPTTQGGNVFAGLAALHHHPERDGLGSWKVAKAWELGIEKRLALLGIPGQ
ncbi:MAG: GDSL-type esterase/lipase family protein [Mycobacterium sp.]